MFSYLAFLWDNQDTTACHVAARLAQSVNIRLGEWRSVFESVGLIVFAQGARPQSSIAVPIAESGGVVLGTLFRYDTDSDTEASDALVTCLDPAESTAIRQDDGKPLLTKFWGRYVAFFRTDAGETAVLRDPSGQMPCICLDTAGVHVVCSKLDDALAITGVRPCVNWTTISARAVLGHYAESESALDGVRTIRPGECMKSISGITSFKDQWSSAEISRDKRFSEPSAAADALYRSVRKCVRTWEGVYRNRLFELSGGLDSSIVAMSLQSPSNGTVAVNLVTCDAKSDERYFARLVAERAGIPLLERHRVGDPVLAESRGFLSTPTPTARALPALDTMPILREIARDRASDCIMNGEGGDEVFHALARRFLDDNDSNADQRLFLLVATCRRFLSSGLRTRAATADRWLPTHMLPASGLLPGDAWHALQIHLPRYDFYDLLSQPDDPEICSPLCSQPIVEMCLRIPTHVHAVDRRERAVAREAFRRDLPPQVVSRLDKGDVTEHIKALFLKSTPEIHDTLTKGRLGARGMLDTAAIDETLLHRQPSIAEMLELLDYYFIEQWLSRWA